ncbi:MAG: hypothetical protein NZ482_09445 [Gloeomargarita sp. SKYG98]|nr:hypothetical protein [Gloeomargarita sp. SKYG98]
MGFGWLGQEVPYYLAEDLRALLAEFHPVYQQVRVAYNVHFSDTTKHRCTLLRFLFGECFS